jgi:hypothetical protein
MRPRLPPSRRRRLGWHADQRRQRESLFHTSQRLRLGGKRRITDVVAQ